MRAQTIAQLAWYKPRSSRATGNYTCDISNLSPQQASDILHYTECYKDLQFGWNFASAMTESELPFPAVLHGDDLYVWRAFNYLKGGQDREVEQAVAINLDIMSNTRNQLRALLIADDVDCEFVAFNLNLPLGVVKAYEKLFFNVLDRKADRAFIANVVFPNTRLEEAYENYLETAGIGELLMRAGYTHGVKHVLYGAGLGKNPFAGRDAMTGAQELDNMFMADGCYYATAGWLHQSRNAMPISNARLSMQASKMGGAEVSKTAGLPDLGATMRQELIKLGELKSSMASWALAGVQLPTEITAIETTEES